MVVGMIVCVIVGCGYGAHDLLRFNSIRYIGSIIFQHEQ